MGVFWVYYEGVEKTKNSKGEKNENTKKRSNQRSSDGQRSKF